MFSKYNKLVKASMPFGLTLIVLAGASQAGWVTFVNSDIVGIATVFVGVLLIINHFVLEVSGGDTTKKKG